VSPVVASARDPRAPRGRAPCRRRALARVRLDDRPPGRARARRHRDDRLEALDRRLEPDATPREHPPRRRLRHQHTPAFRPLRRQPPLPGRADPRPGARARRRALARRLHDPRMGRLRRRDVCRARGRGGTTPGNPSAPAPGHTDGHQVVVVETGEGPVVLGGDVGTSFRELGSGTTEGQRSRARARSADVALPRGGADDPGTSPGFVAATRVARRSSESAPAWARVPHARPEAQSMLPDRRRPG
jgi:hypothetical protein